MGNRPRRAPELDFMNVDQPSAATHVDCVNVDHRPQEPGAHQSPPLCTSEAEWEWTCGEFKFEAAALLPVSSCSL